jgi:hypothetical protein
MKTKQDIQRHFNYSSMREAIKRMQPDLAVAHKAAHQISDGNCEEERDADRTFELGLLVETITQMCGPSLLLLNEIADALCQVGEGEDG